MAYRCLESWTAGDGNTYQLAQINDFTTIPTSIINATSMTNYSYARVSACPSYVTDLGDLIFDLQRSIDADVTLNFVNTDTIRGLFGRYNYNDTGNRMSGDQWKDLANNRFFKQGGWQNMNSGKIKYYIAIVVDDENERAYVYSIENLYYHWGGNAGWTINVMGGKPNDVDLFFEIFGTHIPKYTANGGGATHIAKVTGQLKDLSSNLSDILMVSGGGGGGLLVGDTDYSGKEAGGISGSGDNSADQSTGNAFGLGESGTNVSGGGSGLYGGYKGTSSKSGGAGSGYIGNSLLSNKKMVGYNVPTSSAEATKTESVNDVSASAVSGKPKSGNGFARVKFLREVQGHIWSTSEQVVGTWINGEPLYEITFYKDSDFAYNDMNNLGALPENFERMVYARGYVQRYGNTEFDVFNTGDSGPIIQIKVYNGYFGANVRGYAIISMAVTFRYTKSSN